MQFIFNGTLDEFKENLQTAAKASYRQIVIYQYEPAVLQIGFLRLGHSGGRFFVADVTGENGKVLLNGEIQNLNCSIPDADTQSTFQKIRDAFFAFTVIYVFLALIPWAVWSIFHIPHPWITFLIPLVIILGCELSRLLRGRKGPTDFDQTDASFLRFMEMVCSRQFTIPTNSRELYEMLIRTDGLHSLPQIENDVITWDLYKDVYVEASITEFDIIIDIVHKNAFYGSLTHYHPDDEEIYDDLRTMGEKGNILVIRKSLAGAEVYYIGKPEKYRFSPTKKRHFGKLIYLEQK